MQFVVRKIYLIRFLKFYLFFKNLFFLETAMGTSLNEADMQNVYRSALNNIIEVIIHR